MPDLKKCSVCLREKLLQEFHLARKPRGERTPRGGMGVSAMCKECTAERRKPGIVSARAAKALLAQNGLKACGKCKKNKPFAEFHKMAASHDGHSFKCKPCVNEDSAEWRKNNPGAHVTWYANNKNERGDYGKRWRAINKEYVAVRMSEWTRKNKARVAAKNAKRLAQKMRAMPNWADPIAIEEIYQKAARLRIETGVKHDVDHIVPLHGVIVSGLHWEGNLQILPKSENIAKLNRYWPDMP